MNDFPLKERRMKIFNLEEANASPKFVPFVQADLEICEESGQATVILHDPNLDHIQLMLLAIKPGDGPDVESAIVFALVKEGICYENCGFTFTYRHGSEARGASSRPRPQLH
jgi:hypothetical protein